MKNIENSNLFPIPNFNKNVPILTNYKSILIVGSNKRTGIAFDGELIVALQSFTYQLIDLN